MRASEDTGSGGNDEKKGYWWNKTQPPPEDEKPPEHPDLLPPPDEEKLLAMYPKDVEKMLEDYKDYALWKMTPEHVSWYYHLQDFARRRSQAFMNETQVVLLQNAGLNMNADYPETTPGIDAHNAAQKQEVNALLDREKDKAALVLLTRKNCPYCKAQRDALRYYEQSHGWQIREFDLDEHPELKVKFSVDYTPTTVVIFRGSDQWFPVSVGVDSVNEIESSVFRAVRLLHGQTTAETYTLDDYQKGGVSDPVRASP